MMIERYFDSYEAKAIFKRLPVYPRWGRQRCKLRDVMALYNGSSPPDQNETRACDASHTARLKRPSDYHRLQ
ncbi:hypothetical protein SFRURICE_007007, partial [Spodoptera frugiperda]